MAQKFFERFDAFLIPCFRAHDRLSAFFSRYLLEIKRTVLIVAHLSLFGFLFPDLRKDFGEMAANVLIVILFLSPFAKVFQTRLLVQLMGIRRELGILMAYLATVHGLGYILDPAWFAVFIAPHWRTDFLLIEPRLLLGMLAYALTLPLLLTSNNLALRFLGGKRWKMLHRLVYGVFVLAIFHRFFTRSDIWFDGVALIEAGILIGAYVLMKLLARRNFIAPLRELIGYVASQYQQYRSKQKAVIAPPQL